MNTRQDHWDHIYKTKTRDEVSWHREHLDLSLQILDQLGIGNDAAIIDVGCGSSTFIDDLINNGCTDITALDISDNALSGIRERLGERSGLVKWIAADITQAKLPSNSYDLWHDRAIFHFLTEKADRIRYVEQLSRSLRSGGYVVIAAFALDGPKKCSGLDIVQYSPELLSKELGGEFSFIDSLNEDHATPFGTVQKFVYCIFKKKLRSET